MTVTERALHGARSITGIKAVAAYASTTEICVMHGLETIKRMNAEAQAKADARRAAIEARYQAPEKKRKTAKGGKKRAPGKRR